MKKASNFAFLSRKRRGQESEQIKPQQMAMQNFGGLILPKTQQDLNVFVVTFDGMKNAEQNLSGGDPYECKKCHAVLNKFSKVLSAKQYSEQQNKQMKLELKEDESYWQCEFCSYPNILNIEKEEIPKKDDVVYMLQSPLQDQVTQNDSTIVFCIDTSGSMNTTSQIQGKVDLKFGISQEQIEMLKQFMQPGDEAQFNFLPGNHNKNKTYVSRKQCILSAIQNQLQELKKIDPMKKVGFITFNNQVTVFADDKTQIVNILGDKLYKKQEIINSLSAFKMVSPLGDAYESLINSLNKTEAKGQTALGPALVSAIQVASKGSPGSSVVLCTDGLANIGVGSLDPFDESCSAFYKQLAQVAQQKNIVINLITIKGQGAKMQVIGQLAKDTNGNIKVVNPEKLQDDFANVLKDEVVGLNVSVKIMLHKAMTFRNENEEFLKDNKSVMVKELPNATVNTRVSFEYQLRAEEDLKFMEIDIDKLKKVPFQSQIIYSSPKGGKFLRVISSQSQTTTEKEEMKKDANIGVVHQRITSNTAALFSKGESMKSMQYNDMWSNYLNNQFQQEKYSRQQETFNTKNRRLQNAMEQRHQKRMPQRFQSLSSNNSNNNNVMIGEIQQQQQQQCLGSMRAPIPQSQQAMNFNQMPGAFSVQQQMQMGLSSFSFNPMQVPPPPPSLFQQGSKQKNFSLNELSRISQMKQENLPQFEFSSSLQSKPNNEIKPSQEVLDSDEEEQELMENMMEKQCYDLD